MELGKIQNAFLRELWPGEATHFTPWLAQNLDVLADKLGMDLELESTEVSVGDFSAQTLLQETSPQTSAWLSKTNLAARTTGISAN